MTTRSTSHAPGIRIRIGVGVMLVLLLFAASTAVAGAFAWRTGAASLGCNGVVNSADSISHGYHYNSALSSGMAAATSWVRTNVIDPSDINTFTVPALAVDTDVVVYDQDYTTFCGLPWHTGAGGIQVLGSAMCVSLATNPADACEKHEVRYDESYTNGATTTQRRWVACHENGHTLGLHHQASNDGSCLYTVTPNNAFSAADYTNINLFYN